MSMYNDFLKNISSKFESNFSEISAIYNFDYGDEFEIALCKALRTILPSYYGICRGCTFSQDGNFVGDDIIIYDQFHFPTLRLLEDNTFAQKQQIPYEAVFAYIEAKNTICINGSDGNSLEKAWRQANAIKNLYRGQVPYSKYSINDIPLLEAPDTWPQIGNPVFTAILSRGVRESTGKNILNSGAARTMILERIETLDKTNSPDLIIADSNLLLIPTINNIIESPYFINEKSCYSEFITERLAYGIGLSLMFYAFDHVKLGQIRWPIVLGNGLNLEVTNM